MLCEGLGDLVVDFCGVLECVVGEGLVAVDLGCAVGEVFGGGVFGVVGAFEGVAAEEGAWGCGGGCGADVVVAHGFYSVVGWLFCCGVYQVFGVAGWGGVPVSHT